MRVYHSEQIRYQTEIHQLLLSLFDEEELKTICFHLGLQYDDLPAAGRSNKARELVQSLERNGRLGELRAVVIRQRPNVTWPAAPGATAPAGPASETETTAGRPDPGASPPTSTAERLLRVFLCHGSEDKEAVRELYRQLGQDGMDPWLDEENILPGQKWDRVIRKAVKDADLILVCLSSRSVQRAGYLQKEIKFVLDAADEQPDETIFIIPVKLDDFEMPDRLRIWQWLILPWPWRNLAEELGYKKLIKSMRVRAESLVTSPPVKSVGLDEMLQILRLPYYSNEAAALAFLVNRVGHVVPDEELSKRIWGEDEADHRLASTIWRLRQKMAQHADLIPGKIVRYRSQGYSFEWASADR